MLKQILAFVALKVAKPCLAFSTALVTMTCTPAPRTDENLSAEQASVWQRQVVLLPVSGMPEGSFLACWRDQVALGVPIQEAPGLCDMPQELAVPGRPDLHLLLAIGGHTPGRKVGSVSCGKGGADPRLTSGGRWTAANHPYDWAPPDPNPNPPTGDRIYQRLDAEAEKAWDSYLQTLERAAMEDTGNNTLEDEKLRDALNKAIEEANRAIEERNKYTQSLVSNPDRLAADFCAEVSEFINNCNRDNWQPFACQEVDRRMRNCADPTIMYTDGDGEAGCPAREPDPEAVRQVMVLACQMRTTPTPGEDPCAPTQTEALVLRGYVRPSLRDSSAQDPPFACGDPRALVSPEMCMPTVTLTEFGRTNVEEILRHVNEKIGGPSFVIPVPPPGPIGPRPGPDPVGPRPQ